jgi:hypothetical protein
MCPPASPTRTRRRWYGCHGPTFDVRNRFPCRSFWGCRRVRKMWSVWKVFCGKGTSYPHSALQRLSCVIYIDKRWNSILFGSHIGDWGHWMAACAFWTVIAHTLKWRDIWGPTNFGRVTGDGGLRKDFSSLTLISETLQQDPMFKFDYHHRPSSFLSRHLCRSHGCTGSFHWLSNATRYQSNPNLSSLEPGQVCFAVYFIWHDIQTWTNKCNPRVTRYLGIIPFQLWNQNTGEQCLHTACLALPNHARCEQLKWFLCTD